MMESSVTFRFKFSKSDNAKWSPLINGLSRNEHGAYLEEYAESFGENAEALVGDLLDVWEEQRGEINTRGSKIHKQSAVIVMTGFRTVEPSVPPMINFLKACGATDIKLEEDYDSNGS